MHMHTNAQGPSSVPTKEGRAKVEWHQAHSPAFPPDPSLFFHSAVVYIFLSVLLRVSSDFPHSLISPSCV